MMVRNISEAIPQQKHKTSHSLINADMNLFLTSTQPHMPLSTDVFSPNLWAVASAQSTKLVHAQWNRPSLQSSL